MKKIDFQGTSKSCLGQEKIEFLEEAFKGFFKRIFMEEQIDILEPNGQKTGESRPRSEVHRLGLWHRTVHIWLRDDFGNILFQLRAHDKENNPNLYDTSCAGHISAGDRSLESAVREIREELGLKKSASDLKFLFEAKHESVLNDGAYLDNEYYDVYLGNISEEEKKRLVPQPHEVDVFRFFSPQELAASLKRHPEKFVSHPEDFKYLLRGVNA
jgi:isopentenyldiphosphate isomerase